MRRRSLEQAVALCRTFAGFAEAHAARVTAARAGDAPLTEVHAPGAGWLTLAGAYGCGKTRLAESLFRWLSKVDPFAPGFWLAGSGTLTIHNRRPECVMMHVNRLIDCTLGGDYGFPEYLGREWVVVVDDLGANRQGSGNSQEMAADVVLRLCAARQGKLTVFTTNLTLTEVAQRIDGRVASRLIRDGDGNHFHQITAGDYAMRKKGGQ